MTCKVAKYNYPCLALTADVPMQQHLLIAHVLHISVLLLDHDLLQLHGSATAFVRQQALLRSEVGALGRADSTANLRKHM